MIFISLNKVRVKPTMQLNDEAAKRIKDVLTKSGVKVLNTFWTLGRYDTIVVYEAPNEKAMMKFLLKVADISSSETLVAVPREEALKLLE